MTFDLGGHAGTQPQRETVSRESNLYDLLAAYDELAAHPYVDGSAIAVVGSSYGGYLATILTSMRPVSWLALRAPALYIDTGWELPKLQLHQDHDLRAYRRSFVEAATNRALRACSAFKGDVLLLESEHDDFIPPAVIKSYRAAFTHARSLTYRCMQGADHGVSDETSQRVYTGLLVQWLAEMLPDARRDRASAPAIAATARQAGATRRSSRRSPRRRRKLPEGISRTAAARGSTVTRRTLLRQPGARETARHALRMAAGLVRADLAPSPEGRSGAKAGPAATGRGMPFGSPRNVALVERRRLAQVGDCDCAIAGDRAGYYQVAGADADRQIDGATTPSRGIQGQQQAGLHGDRSPGLVLLVSDNASAWRTGISASKASEQWPCAKCSIARSRRGRGGPWGRADAATRARDREPNHPLRE